MFKVGDFAVWNEASRPASFTKGKAYKVLKVQYEGDEELIHVYDDSGVIRGRYAKRFKPSVTYWLCIRKGMRSEIGVVYEVVRETRDFIAIVVDGGEVLLSKNRFVQQQVPGLPAEVPYKEPELPKFIKALEEQVGKGFKMDTVACYAVFKPEPDWNTRDVCHARFKGNGDTVGAATWVASAKVEKEYQDSYTAYVKWIVKDSSLKQAFLDNMTLEQIMSSGVEIDVTQPAAVCYTAVIALRMFHEHEHFRKVFHTLYQHGFDMPICFLVASGYHRQDFWQGLSDWHGVLSDATTLKKFKGLMNGVFKPSKPFNGADTGYEDYFCYMHTSDHENESVNKLVKRMLDKRFVQKVDGGWGGKVETTPMEFAPAIAVLLTKEYQNV